MNSFKSTRLSTAAFPVKSALNSKLKFMNSEVEQQFNRNLEIAQQFVGKKVFSAQSDGIIEASFITSNKDQAINKLKFKFPETHYFVELKVH